MTPLKRNLSRLALFILVLLLGAMISGLVYFFKMERNEDTLNILYFRELQRIEGRIQLSIEKVKATANYALSEKDRCDAFDLNSCKYIISRFNELANAANELRDVSFVGLNEEYISQSQVIDTEIDGSNFSFRTPHFNTVEFTLTRYQEYPLQKVSLKLRSSIEPVLNQRMDRFQTVALVDESGEVKGVANNAEKLSSDPERFFKSVSRITLNDSAPDKNDKSGAGNALLLNGTRFTDIQLDGSAFRVYVHPLTSSGLSAEDKHYYLIGLIKKSMVTSQKLKLSPNLLMWLILALLLLISVIPMIKLRFISATYAIQRGDKSQVVLGIIVATSIITIGFSQHLFQSYYTEFKDKQLNVLYEDITRDVKQELSTILQNIRTLEINDEASHPDNYDGRDKVESPYEFLYRPDWIVLDDGREKVLMEFFSSVSTNKKIISTRDKPVLYVSESTLNKKEPDISGREYSRAGSMGDFWELTVHDRDYKLFMQRVFNIEDGRRNLMLALDPAINSRMAITKGVEEGKNASDGEPAKEETHFYIASTRLSVLVDRILPNNFGYAVINPMGDVIFHSDDALSLSENFFTETSQNPHLKTASNHNQLTRKPFEIDYKGIPVRLIVGPLISDMQANGIPWRLIVFFDPSELQMNNMVMVFTAVFLLLLIIIPPFLLLRYVAVQRFWQEISYFDSDKKRYYSVAALFIFCLAIFVVLQMGWVQSLIARVFLWVAACNVLMYIVIYFWKSRLSMYFWWRQPVVVVTLILIPILTLLCLLGWQEYYEISHMNKDFSLVGVLILFFPIIVFFAYRSSPYRKLLYVINKQKKHIFGGFVILLLLTTLLGFWTLSLFILCTLLVCFSLNTERVFFKIKRLRREKCRFSSSYVWFLSGLFYLVSAVPAVLIVYSAHEYLLVRQAQFEEHTIKQNIHVKDNDVESYLNFIKKGCSSSSDCEKTTTHERSFSEEVKRFFPIKLFGEEKQWVDVVDTAKGEHSKFFTDAVFDFIFASTLGNTNFVSHLSYAAQQDLYRDSENVNTHQLVYRPDIFMLAAMDSKDAMLIVLLVSFGVPLGLYITVRQLVVKRLMGEHLQDQYRMRSACKVNDYYATDFPDLNLCAAEDTGHSHLILNTTRLRAEQQLLKRRDNNTQIVIFENRIFRIIDCLDMYYDTTTHADAFYFMARLDEFVTTNQISKIVVALSALEQLSLDIVSRKNALALLYELHLDKRIELIIVAETAPLYRLLNPSAYESGTSLATEIDERTGWTKLFSEFDKHYAWSPVCKSRLDNPFDYKALFDYESLAWPEVDQLISKFDRDKYWEPEQVIEFMLVHAGPLYRRKWEECTVNEKIILWRMAHGASINPESTVTIERLVRRCYLYRDKGWHLINESFRQFVLTAEPESVMKSWMDTTSTGAWSVLRIPIFTLLLVLLAIFIYSSGSSLDTILGIATATLGLIPLLIKNLGMLRGGNVDIE